MRALDLAVVVVNWNVRDLLIACLGTVQTAIDAAGLSGEIWVVDNASHDGSAALIETWFPDVRLVASHTNLGFGGGNNVALRRLGFDVHAPALADDAPPVSAARDLPRYVLLLNPDTSVREDAIAMLVTFMDAHPQAGVCGPRLVYGDGGFQHSAYRFPSLMQTVLDFWPINWRLTDSRLNGRYPRRWYENGAPFPVDHPLGAAMLFRGETIAQTGGFDLDYRMYVEEIDWCMRVKRAGWQIYCLPRAQVVHYEGQSTRQVRPQMIVELWKSRYIFFRKHYSARYRWAARRLIRAGMRAEIRRAQGRVQRGEIEAAEARALIDAYRQVMAM